MTTDIIVADVEDVFRDAVGFMPFMYAPPMLAVLRHGGYIAGGFPRWLLAEGNVSARYFGPKVRGDIDVFFRSHADFEAACDELARYTFEQGGLRSAAGFAMNFSAYQSVPAGARGGGGSPIRMQLVDSHFGEPVDMLKRFDMRNSMVAFDMSRGYVADGWKELQENGTIDVTRVTDNAQMLGHRIGKYVAKYGYTSLSPTSIAAFEAWFYDFKDNEVVGPSRDDVRRPWVNLQRLKPIIEQTNIPNELLPMLAGITQTMVKSSKDNFYRGDVWEDCAVAALERRDAPRHLVEAARLAADGRKLKKAKEDIEVLAAQNNTLTATLRARDGAPLLVDHSRRPSASLFNPFRKLDEEV